MVWAYIGEQVSGSGPEGSLQFHTTEGRISGSENLLYNSTSNTLILSGNLYVSGTTTTISSSELAVIDKHIRLAASSSDVDLAALITAGTPPSIQFGTASVIAPSEAPFEIQLFSSSYADQISGSGFCLLRSGSQFSLEGTQQYASLRVNALSASGDIFTAGGLLASSATFDGALNVLNLTASTGVKAVDLLITNSASVGALGALNLTASTGVKAVDLLITNSASVGALTALNLTASTGVKAVDLLVTNSASVGSTLDVADAITAINLTASTGVQATDLIVNASASVGTTLDVAGALTALNLTASTGVQATDLLIHTSGVIETTLDVGGLANLDGGIEVDQGGNKFTVDTGGVVVAAGSVSALNLTASTGVKAVDLLVTNSASVGTTLGIGTDAPEAYLDIKNTVDDGAVNRTMLRLHNYRSDDADHNDFGPISIDFEIEQLSGGAKSGIARIAAVQAPSGTDHTIPLGEKTSGLTFSTMNLNVLSEAMRIDASGNVGIGTAEPGSALDVVGAVIAINLTASTGVQATDLIVNASASVGTTLDVAGALTALNLTASTGVKAVDLLVNSSASVGTTLDVVGALTALNLTASTGVQATDLLVHTSASVVGALTAGSFYGDGTNITGVTGEWDGTHVGDASITGDLTVIALTASTGVKAVDLLVTNSASVGTTLDVVGALTALNLTASTGVQATDLLIHTSGVIETTLDVGGALTALNLTASTGVQATDLLVNSSASVGTTLDVGGALTALNLTASTGVQATDLLVHTSASVETTLGVGGALTALNLTASTGVQAVDLLVNSSASVGTTLGVNGLANLDGGIEIDNGGNKFTVSTGGAVVAASTLNVGTVLTVDTALTSSGGGYFADNVGVMGLPSASVSFNINHTGSGNPTALGNNTGGGEIVYFGTSSVALATGALYFLNSLGGWAPAAAWTTSSNATGEGGSSESEHGGGGGNAELLGISLGALPGATGMLIRGFYDVHTYFSGAFIPGGPVYIGSSSAGENGYMSGASPTAGNSFVRVVGYGTDTANVIYFNPDATYIEIQEEEEE